MDNKTKLSCEKVCKLRGDFLSWNDNAGPKGQANFIKH